MGIESVTTNKKVNVVITALREVIEATANDLETVTLRIEQRLQPLKLTELPEYQQALDAIKAYANAVYTRAEALHEEEREEKKE